MNATLEHRLEKCQAAADVVAQVWPRRGHRLGHRLFGRQVKHDLDGVLLEHTLDERPVGDVAHDARDREGITGLADRPAVQHHDAVAGGKQMTYAEATHVAGPTGDKDFHRIYPRSRVRMMRLPCRPRQSIVMMRESACLKPRSHQWSVPVSP